SYIQLIEQGVINLGDLIDVCIPTGNFGNILGAVFARELGLPIRNLIAASNENNVITDFIRTGSYDLRHRSFQKTISPSIDLLINGDYTMVKKLFNKLTSDHYFNIDSNLLQKIQSQIHGDWTNENQCLETMKNIYKQTQQLIDPHTAVAVHVAEKFSKNDST